MSIRGKAQFFILAIVILTLDLWSKSWAFQYIENHGVNSDLHGGEKAVEVIPGFFYFTRVYNTGGIWGIAQEGIFSKALVLLRILAVPGIIYLALRTPARERIFVTALGLFCAGAIGNLYDNLFMQNGSVRDFLDFFLIGPQGYHWPTFNIADSGIVCGVILLFADMLFTKRAPAPVKAVA